MPAAPQPDAVVTSWREEASCKDWPAPDDFFPDQAAPRPAVLLVCGRCPVAQACGTEALRSGQRYGVWGGMTEVDRDRLTGRTKGRRSRPISA